MCYDFRPCVLNAHFFFLFCFELKGRVFTGFCIMVAILTGTTQRTMHEHKLNKSPLVETFLLLSLYKTFYLLGAALFITIFHNVMNKL